MNNRAACDTRERAALAVFSKAAQLANASGDVATWTRPIRLDSNGVAKSRTASSAKSFPKLHKAYHTLKAVQAEIARLAAPEDASLRFLAMTMVSNKAQVLSNLETQLRQLDQTPLDFSVYHYDATGVDHPKYATYASASWYRDSKQIVRRAFRTGTGCQVEAIKEVIYWLLHGSRIAYSHLWLLDNDMDFRLFSFPACMRAAIDQEKIALHVHPATRQPGLRFSSAHNPVHALVAFRRPFICQPAMLALFKGKRATDRYSLKATFDIHRPAGRERLQDTKHHVPLDDVDNQPLIDVMILPALYAALEPLDTRDQVSQVGANCYASPNPAPVLRQCLTTSLLRKSNPRSRAPGPAAQCHRT